jgi:hypothetical protein
MKLSIRSRSISMYSTHAGDSARSCAFRHIHIPAPAAAGSRQYLSASAPQMPLRSSTGAWALSTARNESAIRATAAVMDLMNEPPSESCIFSKTLQLFSPVFVPMVAMSLKNREIIPGGIAAGIIGYVGGTYLGVFFTYTLKLYF